MNRLFGTACIVIVTIVCAAASDARGAESTAASGAVATVQQFIANFNAGNVDAARATHVADPAILDEVPPFLWQGAGAFDAWLASLGKYDTAHGVTDQNMTLGDVIREESEADGAYVVMAAVYSFKEQGIAKSARAQMTFALRKNADGWRIAAWTYSAPRATAPQ
jgi:ketosteroid isomerase-like protein